MIQFKKFTRILGAADFVELLVNQTDQGGGVKVHFASSALGTLWNLDVAECDRLTLEGIRNPTLDSLITMVIERSGGAVHTHWGDTPLDDISLPPNDLKVPSDPASQAMLRFALHAATHGEGPGYVAIVHGNKAAANDPVAVEEVEIWAEAHRDPDFDGFCLRLVYGVSESRIAGSPKPPKYLPLERHHGH